MAIALIDILHERGVITEKECCSAWTKRHPRESRLPCPCQVVDFFGSPKMMSVSSARDAFGAVSADLALTVHDAKINVVS